jgi:hypothetical protein
MREHACPEQNLSRLSLKCSLTASSNLLVGHEKRPLTNSVTKKGAQSDATIGRVLHHAVFEMSGDWPTLKECLLRQGGEPSFTRNPTSLRGYTSAARQA